MLILLLTFYCAVVCASVPRAVTRDYFVDVFHMKECNTHNATRCHKEESRLALEVPGRPCFCQCAPSHFAYREDKDQCVKEIKECYMSVFFRPYTIESIPLVFLPTSGQLVHPDAHLSLVGRKRSSPGLPRCKATVSQYMTSEGWKTITREGSGGAIFGLFVDGNKTFLQFLGSPRDRQQLQHHLLLIRMFCKLPEYAPFETCVAVRVGWAPGVESVDAPDISSSKANMLIVGLSLGVLGLVYVLAVLVYLKLRRKAMAKAAATVGKAKGTSHPNSNADLIQIEQVQRLDPSRRLEMYHTHSLGRSRGSMLVGDQRQDSPDESYNRNWADGGSPLQGSQFKVQDFQLQPEYFEPELLASPPQPVLEFLRRLQNSMTFARHRLRSYYRYQPTLLGIPEDDYFYQDADQKQHPMERSVPDGDSCFGGSSSSMTGASSDSASASRDKEPAMPRPPPRKCRGKRSAKLARDPYGVSRGCDVLGLENIPGTEDERYQIKNAMDTLNRTLEALERDIFQQDLRNRLANVSKNSNRHSTKRGNGKTATSPRAMEVEIQNSKMEEEECAIQFDSSDGRDFDSSSCSSVSVITVLNNDLHAPLGKNKANVETKQSSRSCGSDWLLEEIGMIGQMVKNGDEFPSNGEGMMELCEKGRRGISKDDRGQIKEERSMGAPRDANVAENDDMCVFHMPLMCEQETKKDSELTFNPQVKIVCCQEGIKFPVLKGTDEHRFQSAVDQTDNTDTEVTEVTESDLGSIVDATQWPSDDLLLQKSSSTDSMATTATDMTQDSLDARDMVEEEPPPSRLLDLWVSRLSKSSVPYIRNGRKPRKRGVDAGSWDHICHKYRNPCPVHDIHTCSTLIEKLAHYGAKTMAGCDVASYFQALKQDVLKEQLKGWLMAHQGKKSKLGTSVKYRKRNSSHRKPLVMEGADLVQETGEEVSDLTSGSCCSSTDHVPDSDSESAISSCGSVGRESLESDAKGEEEQNRKCRWTQFEEDVGNEERLPRVTRILVNSSNPGNEDDKDNNSIY